MVKLFTESKPEVSKSSLRVLEIIKEKWPVNPLEVARELGENGKTKTLSARYLYHFRKLKELELINMKRVGNTYVAWPLDVEKLRFIHEMIR